MESPRKFLRYLPNLALAALVIFLAIKRVPSVIEQYSSEGRSAPAFSLPTLDGKNFDLTASTSPTVIVFWATWCGPCTLELARLNDLVKDGAITGGSVLAISSYEDRALVEQTARERDYRFTIGLDFDGSIAGLYNVAGTPTVVFVDKDRKIDWITTGLSPTLGFRARRFLAR